MGTNTHPAYGLLTLSQPRPHELAFAYYDFQGPVRSRTGGFAAFTSHYTGSDMFNLQLLKDARHEVTGLAIAFSYSLPLVFTKNAARTSPPRPNRAGHRQAKC